MTHLTCSSTGYNTNSSDDCPTQFQADPTLVLAPPHLICPQEPQTSLLRHVSSKSNTKTLAQSCLDVRCPLCASKRTNFYCATCVVSGDFVHSTTKLFERFSEKNLRLFALQRDNSECKSLIEQKTETKWHRHRLKEDIKLARNKIKYFRHVIKQNIERRSQSLAILGKLKSSNNKRQQRLPEFADKASRMRSCADNFVVDMAKTRDRLKLSWKELRLNQSVFVTSLHSDVFPLTEVLPSGPYPQPDLMLDCLADAMRTSYIHGRWVTGDRSGEVQYRLVTPLLSGSGDYTPVYAWIAGNKGGAGTGCGDRDVAFPAHNIAAGLALACQLVGLLARVLDVHLPARIQHQEFGVIETSEFRFARKVTKLNLNVVFLCLSQGMPPHQIQPCQTLSNLLGLARRAEHLVLLGQLEEEGEELSSDLLAEWEVLLHREAEELRLAQLTDSEDSETGQDSDGEMSSGKFESEWESLTSDQVEEVGREQRGLDRQTSIAFVSSTVSSLLWGFTQSPKSPKK